MNTVSLHVSELRGFLGAMQVLCGDRYSFGVDCLDDEGGVESSVLKHFSMLGSGFQCNSVDQESFEDVKSLLDKYLFRALPALGQGCKKRIARQLIEYYGLIATAENEFGAFNPLSVQGAIYVPDVSSVFYVECSYYAVKVGRYIVLTGLGVKRDS
ncbi:hypothetical protein LRS11_16055 [Pseudomonas sp. J452]|uniref:hypothetical protein n=1 Tax=Pseudomonas sp. J452 TaxID=2898441 RepID=UPI0021AD7824|nr:hypothetical protein [Pseudomonas sp. J452]UUY07327.1 hypothetical protein LRS11_16055 [Pseudomonas sp. J452]